MYGQYTKDLGDFARRQAAIVKLTERRKGKAPQKLSQVDRIKSE